MLGSQTPRRGRHAAAWDRTAVRQRHSSWWGQALGSVRRRVCMSRRRSAANRVAGAPSTTLWSMVTVRSRTSRISTRSPTARGRRLTPPTTRTRDASVGGAMAKPPPSANMPTAVTWTVPVARWTRRDRLITGVHRPVQTGNRVRGAGARVSSRRPLLVVGVGLDGPDLGADVGDAADVGVADDVDQPERPLARWVPRSASARRRGGVRPTGRASRGRRAPRSGAAAARPSEATTKAVNDSGGSCSAEQAPGGGDVDVEQPVHRHDPAAGADRRGDQPAAGRERPHHDTPLPGRSGVVGDGDCAHRDRLPGRRDWGRSATAGRRPPGTGRAGRSAG